MAIDLTDLKNLYSMFSEETNNSLKSLYEDTNMEDEFFANMASQSIIGAMDSSVKALETFNRKALIDAQVITENKQQLILDKQVVTEENKALDIASQTSVRNTQSAKDIEVKSAQITSMGKEDLIKDKQVVTEENKALDIASQTSVRNAQSEQDIMNKASQKSLIDAQIITESKQQTILDKQALDIVQATLLKTSQTSYTNNQSSALTQQLSDNRNIKAIDSLASTYGTLGAGGLTVSSEMWTCYFDIINSLTTISIPAAANIEVTKVT